MRLADEEKLMLKVKALAELVTVNADDSMKVPDALPRCA